MYGVCVQRIIYDYIITSPLGIIIMCVRRVCTACVYGVCVQCVFWGVCVEYVCLSVFILEYVHRVVFWSVCVLESVRRMCV